MSTGIALMPTGIALIPTGIASMQAGIARIPARIVPIPLYILFEVIIPAAVPAVNMVNVKWRGAVGLFTVFHLLLSLPREIMNGILSMDELRAERARLRAAGLRLVFTNGCFDILHVGHVRYLKAARALGDVLLVAINSDRTVRELKGLARPVMNEAERAEMLAALRAVDYVTIFDEVSPRALIRELLPDVLVKGGDYALDEIHGREEVEAAGGRVLSLPFVEGASTSGIIERLKKRGQGSRQ
jgi:D-glycero-beta-D-manno-heptose 1-phosphate adenylyltransferase